jgi:GNAT superfamily N-acetyltransferase
MRRSGIADHPANDLLSLVPTDMLIKLYAVPDASADGSQETERASSAVIRKPIGPEHLVVADWVLRQFGGGWASEARVALGNRPVTLWLATTPTEVLGFCCYDATARGYVGPIGIAPAARGRGVGAALLRACLHDMRAAGYGYAIAGAVGAPEFFERIAGAVQISDSTPGLYRDQLRA